MTSNTQNEHLVIFTAEPVHQRDLWECTSEYGNIGQVVLCHGTVDRSTLKFVIEGLDLFDVSDASKQA